MNQQNQSIAAKPQSQSGLLTQLSERYAVEPPKLLETLKATVFDKDASHEEMIAFLTVANRYELDPFRGEIYAFRKKGKKLDDGSYAKGGVQAIVGVDGWASIVNRQPMFDGVEFADDWSSDGKDLRAVRCTIWRKDRTRPTVVTEYLVECRQNTFPWQNYPTRMLRHKAFIQCARLAFGVSGVMDEEEAHGIDRAVSADVTVRPHTQQASAGERLKSLTASARPVDARGAPGTPVSLGDVMRAAAPVDAAPEPVEPPASGDQVAMIEKICSENGISTEAAVATIRVDYQLPASVKTLADLPATIAAKFIADLAPR